MQNSVDGFFTARQTQRLLQRDVRVQTGPITLAGLGGYPGLSGTRPQTLRHHRQYFGRVNSLLQDVSAFGADRTSTVNVREIG